MQKIKQAALSLYYHHGIRYLFVGGTTFIIDLGLLIILHGFIHINLAVATSASYWLAICYNFILNRWWTFSASENSSLKKHLPPYLLLLGFNYMFTVLFVVFVSRILPYEVAKIIALPIQMSWTYPLFKKIFTPVTQSS
jgi:putative flippase GtrA